MLKMNRGPHGNARTLPPGGSISLVSPRLESRFRRPCHGRGETRPGRRYSKVVSNWTGSAWTRVLHEKFLYEGWNLLGAFNGTNAAIIRSFLWGLDLSGSMQGAGGVGGLIAFRQHSGSLAGSHFAAYDGNGNVMALVDGKTGSTSARYEYDPFGQTIRASGTMAVVNPVRFSSKVVDDETDYAYYGYRYLNPNAGRWLTRDPIEEKGGANLYELALNDPINAVDPLGLRRLTGVKICREPGFGYHEWLEYPGGSVGFYPGDAGIYPGGTGRIISPDLHYNDKDKICFEVSVADCVDTDCFRKCIGELKDSTPGFYCIVGSHCRNFVWDNRAKCENQCKNK